jgi:toxin ParE1/3/4
MPPDKPYRFHPEASEELEAADDWYFSRSVDASIDFVSEVDLAIEAITQTPHRWPKHLYGTRRFVLQRFPFSVIYLDDPDAIVIIAVAHAKRKPGYWKGRL